MSADTDTKILTAAAELFAERGYAATTTRAIAERAGVNEVTLFRRFQSKAGVLRALGERFSEGMAGFAAATLPEPEDTLGTIRALGRLEVESALRTGGVAMRLALDAQSVPEVAELLGEGPPQNLAGLAEYFAQRQAGGDLRSDIEPRVMAETFFALTSTLVMSRQLLGHAGAPEELGEEAMLDQVLGVFWSGVRKQD